MFSPKVTRREQKNQQLESWGHDKVLTSLICAARRMRVRKPSAWATALQVFSIIQGKAMAHPFQALLRPGSSGYTVAIITAHEPG